MEAPNGPRVHGLARFSWAPRIPVTDPGIVPLSKRVSLGGGSEVVPSGHEADGFGCPSGVLQKLVWLRIIGVSTGSVLRGRAAI